MSGRTIRHPTVILLEAIRSMGGVALKTISAKHASTLMELIATGQVVVREVEGVGRCVFAFPFPMAIDAVTVDRFLAGCA